MANKLRNLTMSVGFKSMKDLSRSAQIPYSTILNYNQSDIGTWQTENIAQIAKALGMNKHDFLNDFNHPTRLPFVKWAGGKRQLLSQLVRYIPKDYHRYIEPFVGGGALFFKLSPQHAIINDMNSELINTWRVLRDEPKNLTELLNYHEKHDSKEHYSTVRAVDRTGEIRTMSNVERAARFIYLNKSGYNGLYRVNSRDQFNVPFGGHRKLNLVPDFFHADANYLGNNDVQIENRDYQEVLQKAHTGDFVYLDPPYIPVTMTASFTSYTKDGFGLVQQKELAQHAIDLAQKGVKVMLSNSDVKLIKELYPRDIFKIHHVKAGRAINSNAQKRGKVGEVIITSRNF